jgi:hypothetical protein
MSDPRIVGSFWSSGPSSCGDSDDPCNNFPDLLVAGNLSSYRKSRFLSIDGGFVFCCLQCYRRWYVCNMAEQQDS